MNSITWDVIDMTDFEKLKRNTVYDTNVHMQKKRHLLTDSKSKRQYKTNNMENLSM